MSERRCTHPSFVDCEDCEPQEGASSAAKTTSGLTGAEAGGAPSCDSAELAALRLWASRRLDGEALALVRMVDELRAKLAEAEIYKQLLEKTAASDLGEYGEIARLRLLLAEAEKARDDLWRRRDERLECVTDHWRSVQRENDDLRAGLGLSSKLECQDSERLARECAALEKKLAEAEECFRVADDLHHKEWERALNLETQLAEAEKENARWETVGGLLLKRAESAEMELRWERAKLEACRIREELGVQELEAKNETQSLRAKLAEAEESSRINRRHRDDMIERAEAAEARVAVLEQDRAALLAAREGRL
jgi:hypothetical protein